MHEECGQCVDAGCQYSQIAMHPDFGESKWVCGDVGQNLLGGRRALRVTERSECPGKH